MPSRPRLTFSRVEIAFGVVACLSILLIFIPKTWLSHTYTFDPLTYKPKVYGDTYSGGNSTAGWIDQAKQSWRCEIGNTLPNPFCSVQYVVLTDTWAGLDLRHYSTMKVFGEYEGDDEHIRIYLRNRHPDYFKIGSDTSTKYNMVEIPVESLSSGFTLNMKDFTVADWWVTENRIPLDRSHPEFNDIIYIEVQTGSRTQTGQHAIQLRKIVWSGNIISDEQLYKYLSIMWSSLILGYLLYRLISLNIALKKHQDYQKELVSINSLLNLKNREFEELAKTDQLTGLLNRIGMRECLYDCAKRWNKNRTPFSLIMIDIDHFKQVNDTFGHDVGDEILKGTATTLQSNIRSTDYLARWGGEEFILVCPNATLEQASTIAESLRSKLDGAHIHPDVKVSASFGVATMSQPELEPLFKLADEALYDAKARGRNCVSIRA